MKYQSNPILEFFGLFQKDKFDLMDKDQLVEEAKTVISVYQNREIPRVKKFIEITQKKIDKLLKKPILFSRKLDEIDLENLKELKVSLKKAYNILRQINIDISSLTICIHSNAFNDIKKILRSQPVNYDFSEQLKNFK